MAHLVTLEKIQIKIQSERVRAVLKYVSEQFWIILSQFDKLYESSLM